MSTIKHYTYNPVDGYRAVDDDDDAPTGRYSMDEAIRREWLNDHGWIPHDGGERPLILGTRTAVRFRDGYEDISDCPSGWNWAHAPSPGRVDPRRDIIAYRIADQAKPDSPNDHYRQGDIECIDAIRAALTGEEWRGYCKGNVLKYTWREKHKGGDGSLLKAQDYLRWAVAGKAEDKR
jgi:hypothetical protein